MIQRSCWLLALFIFTVFSGNAVGQVLDGWPMRYDENTRPGAYMLSPVSINRQLKSKTVSFSKSSKAPKSVKASGKATKSTKAPSIKSSKTSKSTKAPSIKSTKAPKSSVKSTKAPTLSKAAKSTASKRTRVLTVG